MIWEIRFESYNELLTSSFEGYICVMRIELIIADFESTYSTSFQHTARVKYGVDFNTSNVDTLSLKLDELKEKVVKNLCNNVHVGLEITVDHVSHVQYLLNQILEKYKEVFHILPVNRKIYTINRKLREADLPSTKDLAKQVLVEILTPETTAKQTKAQRIKTDAEALSKRRTLEIIKKNSAKTK